MKKFLNTIFKIFLLLLLVAVSHVEASAADDGRIRVGVTIYPDVRGNIGNGLTEEDAQIMTNMLTEELTKTRNIRLYERRQLDAAIEELRRGGSIVMDERTIMELGKMSGLQYVLTGSIDYLGRRESRENWVVGEIFSIEEKLIINIRMLDVATGEVLLAASEEGSARTRQENFVGIQTRRIEAGGLRAQAVRDSMSRLSIKVRDGLTREFLFSSSDLPSLRENRIPQEPPAINSEPLPQQPHALTMDFFFQNFGDVQHWLGQDGITARGAVVTAKNDIDFRSFMNSGWIMHTARVPYGNTGDTSAQRGETITIYIPDGMPAFRTVSDNARDQQSSFEPPPLTLQPQVEGFNPNVSDTYEVIQTYPISPGQANLLIIGHNTALRQYSGGNFRDAYETFSKSVDSYSGNYLAAYWAGESARKLGDNSSAISWYDWALSINPNYEPALRAKAQM